jgi:hypothetical protein
VPFTLSGGTDLASLGSRSSTESTLKSSDESLTNAGFDLPPSSSPSADPEQKPTEPTDTARDPNATGVPQDGDDPPPAAAAAGMSTKTRTIIIVACAAAVILIAGLIFYCVRSTRPSPGAQWRASNEAYMVGSWRASGPKEMDMSPGYPDDYAAGDYDPYAVPPPPPEMADYASSYWKSPTQAPSATTEGSASAVSYARQKSPRKTSTVFQPAAKVRRSAPSTVEPDARTLWTDALTDEKRTVPESTILPVGPGFGGVRNILPSDMPRPRRQEDMTTTIYRGDGGETNAETNWDSVSQRAQKKKLAPQPLALAEKRKKKASGLMVSEAFLDNSV